MKWPRDSVEDDSAAQAAGSHYGKAPSWTPQRPRPRPGHVLVSWLVATIAVLVAGAISPGVNVPSVGDALLAAALIAILNALLPPLVAALRLPFTLALGFVLVLILDALVLLLVSDIAPEALQVRSFGDALVASLVMAGASVVLQVIFNADDDDTYTLQVIQRIARRQGGQPPTYVPGIVCLEVDGLALPVLKDAMRDGYAPVLARWLLEGTHRLVEWETDLSSQTGASQAGILLGSNEDIPAFRWVEKETGRLMTCSAPADLVEIERRHDAGRGLLIDGGASRGNLLSGEADEVILTASRMEAEKQANPGYRSFLANGFNVTRLLVLFWWEVMVEWFEAARQRRRDIQPRGHRGGKYPFLRAALCVGVRDLIVFGVLTDMMAGRPAVYATFSSYDEVAHHSGLERSDTMEALSKLDQQFERISRARRYARRPYKLIVLSDHGQTQGATFKQRNGYGLDELVERSLARGSVSGLSGGDENHAAVGNAVREATGRKSSAGKHKKDDVSDRQVVVLGSGNLGLVYLMDEKRRLTLEEIERLHPRLLGALREHPHIGFLLVHSAEHGPVVLGARGTRYLASGRVEGEDPLADFPSNTGTHLARTDTFEHVADIMVNSFYDSRLEEGAAFEELISFHGGVGGPQTRAFLFYPSELPAPPEPIVGAAAVNEILTSWRRVLQSSEISRASASDNAGTGARILPSSQMTGTEDVQDVPN